MKLAAKSVLLAAAGALALGACETVDEAVVDTFGNEFRADLNGANEPGGGDPDGSGIARVETNDTLNTVCADLEVRDIGIVTAAHIHRGAAGVNGPPVVNLDVPDADGDEDDCDHIGDELVDDIARNPAGFYVNVHTGDFPEGAIRGQLMPSAD